MQHRGHSIKARSRKKTKRYFLASWLPSADLRCKLAPLEESPVMFLTVTLRSRGSRSGSSTSNSISAALFFINTPVVHNPSKRPSGAQVLSPIHFPMWSRCHHDGSPLRSPNTATHWIQSVSAWVRLLWGACDWQRLLLEGLSGLQGDDGLGCQGPLPSAGKREGGGSHASGQTQCYTLLYCGVTESCSKVASRKSLSFQKAGCWLQRLLDILGSFLTLASESHLTH